MEPLNDLLSTAQFVKHRRWKLKEKSYNAIIPVFNDIHVNSKQKKIKHF